MKTLITTKPLLYADITEKILEAAFEVSKELGSGFLESVYKNAMVIALRAMCWAVLCRSVYKWQGNRGT